MVYYANKKPASNSKFSTGGVSCSAGSLVVAESFMLLLSICGKKPSYRKSASRLNKMNFLITKTILCLVLMMVFLMIAVISNDVINRQLFASLGIITGAFTSKFLSNQTHVKNE
jgi:hypothetical protein